MLAEKRLVNIALQAGRHQVGRERRRRVPRLDERQRRRARPYPGQLFCPLEYLVIAAPDDLIGRFDNLGQLTIALVKFLGEKVPHPAQPEQAKVKCPARLVDVAERCREADFIQSGAELIQSGPDYGINGAEL